MNSANHNIVNMRRLRHSRKVVNKAKRYRKWDGISATKTTSSKNPFLIDLILSKIFSFCDKQTLKYCRLVSKQWKLVSFPDWDKTAPCLVVNKDSVRGIHKITEKNSKDMFDDYPSMRKVKLVNIEFNEEVLLHDVFWKPCGSWMQELHLEFCHFRSKQTFYDILTSKYTPILKVLNINRATCTTSYQSDASDLVTKNALVNPNLKQFKVYFREYPNPTYKLTPSSTYPMDWYYILSRYPKLNHLQVGDDKCFLKNLLLAIIKIQEDKLKLPLESFKVDSYPCLLDSAILDLLQRAKLPFTKYVHYSVKSFKAFSQFLSTHSKSLKKLEHWGKCDIKDNLPRMEFVQDIKLGKSTLSNFNFLRFFPNLKSFELVDCIKKWDNLGEIVEKTDVMICLENVKTLILSNSKENKVFCGVSTLQKFTQWMPNVTVVKLAVAKDAFHLVWEWKKLQEVYLTGMDLVMEDDCIVDNIENMKELKILDMPRDFALADSKLTAKSFQEGFIKLTKLKRLTLRMTPGFSSYICEAAFQLRDRGVETIVWPESISKNCMITRHRRDNKDSRRFLRLRH